MKKLFTEEPNLMRLIEIDKDFPRPDFRRRDWQSLNGEWDFAFGFDGEAKPAAVVFDKKINVPFVYQSKLSGICSPEKHETVWYKKSFAVKKNLAKRNLRLVFGAVDYFAEVWLNGVRIGSHTGGYTQFDFDITPFVLSGENTLIVKARDSFDRFLPRGKQYCDGSPDRCWYEASTGIWQTVWLEAVGGVRLEHVLVTPNIKTGRASVEYFIKNPSADTSLKVWLGFKGKVLACNEYSVSGKVNRITLDIREPDFVDENHYWSPERPNLFDLHLELVDNGATVDEVSTYFGMREIEVRGGVIMLNNKPYYQKLVLDQGYYENSLLTPPDADALIYDLKTAKEFGFNGVRRHQVVSDPRFYHYADVFGLLVWEEIPSGYEFCFNEAEAFYSMAADLIRRDFNHPSVIVWCPMNESWGIRNVRYDKKQQDFVRALYHIFKSFDGTRLVTCNDGWEVVGGDICAQHNYFAGGDEFKRQISDIQNYKTGAVSGCRMSLADGASVENVPILLSEFGGISFCGDGGWGYCDAVKNEDAFIERFGDIVGSVYGTDFLQGFCYTQLTDVFQETNGLMKLNRELKLPIDKIKSILDKKRNY
ncbi:MAG: glycoside hydrolase family 2 [Clostridiales bacterium]|jgi:beta-galactosidase/beta-glucuronidase|nr:glycoside hydrolase family 2 [Clostridiales bacterium]